MPEARPGHEPDFLLIPVSELPGLYLAERGCWWVLVTCPLSLVVSEKTCSIHPRGAPPGVLPRLLGPKESQS